MMADFDIDNPVFEPDDWEENIGDDDVLSTSLHDADDTSGVNSMGTSIQTSLQQELLQTAQMVNVNPVPKGLMLTFCALG